MKSIFVFFFSIIFILSQSQVYSQSWGEKLGKNLRKVVEKTKETSQNVFNKSKETTKNLYEKGKETWKNTRDDRQKFKDKIKNEGKGFIEGWRQESENIKKNKNK